MKDTLKSMLSIPLQELHPHDRTELPVIDRRILDAALEQFAEKGYDGATTLAIARSAGVSEKTLFQHFGSKERLFIRTVYPSLLESILPLINRDRKQLQEGKHRPLADHLLELAQERLSFTREQPRTVQLLLQELLLRTPNRDLLAGFWMEQVAPAFTEFFESRQAAGEIRDFPVSTILRVIAPVLMSYVAIRGIILPDAEWDDNRELEQMLDIILNGLLPR